MDLKLAGKTVMITGGSKGIGAACARSFAAEGCALKLIARNPDALEALAQSIRTSHGVRVETHALDLRNPGDLDAAVGLCTGLDILVNNAGDIPAASLDRLDDATWRHAWELKVFSYITLSRAAFVAMRERGQGVITNVIGMAAERPTFEYICGASANAGLAAFTKALGQGSLRSGVRVMGVHPPSTKTERIDAIHRMLAKQHYGDESRVDDLFKDKLATPAIDPEQVADAVTYLSSARASQLTGIVMNLGLVNG
jgi:NAD(P)-dependent dehydrogenase (short-subunit alcohol dehydrogenase family)